MCPPVKKKVGKMTVEWVTGGEDKENGDYEKPNGAHGVP